MPAKTSTHPTSEQLAAYAHGRLDLRTQLEVESHIGDCDRCCQALRQVPDDTLLGRLKHTDTSPDATLAIGGQVEAPAEREIPTELLDHPRYRILKLLGVGGMGEVYQAEQKLMERKVAIKVIRRSLLDRPQALDRFLLEVKAAGRLQHPNIVVAHDADKAGDLHFLVTEYVEGTSLARLVEKHGARPVVHACNYVRQAALGLQHAYERGMVHRDIKPQNLMLTPKGQVKILDFGLARFARESEPRTVAAADAETQAGGLTAMGTILGTPDYIAPEQTTDSHTADIRADIYSLGCTLYYLLAGCTPFPTGTVLQKFKLHRDHTPRPISELRDDVPSDLVVILDKMMAKDPGQRYQTPGEVAQALAIHARPPSPSELAATRVEAPPPEKDLSNILELPLANLPPPANYQWEPWQQSKRPSKTLLGQKPQTLAIGFAALVVLSLGLAYLMSPGTDKPADVETRQTAGLQPRQEDRPPVTKPAPVAAPRVAGQPTILYVLPAWNFWYPDYGPVREYLERQGARVVVASSAAVAQPASGEGSGPPVTADLWLGKARAADYDAVIICGGPGAMDLINSEKGRVVGELIKQMLASGKHVSALCMGPAVLANAGVLEGQQATSFMNVKEAVQRGGAEWVNQPVVVSGKIITGRSADDADEFARVLWEQVKQSR